MNGVKWWFAKDEKGVRLPVDICEELLRRGYKVYFEGGEFIGQNKYSVALRREAAEKWARELMRNATPECAKVGIEL